MGMSDYVRRLRERVGNDLLFWPAIACLIRDDQGRVLLVRHVDGGRWTFPGGGIDPGERPWEAARRECLEETGVAVEPLGIAGVYGGDPHFHGFYSNGDEVKWITILFKASIVSGEPAPSDDETAEVRWVDLQEAFELDLSASTRWMLERDRDGVSYD